MQTRTKGISVSNFGDRTINKLYQGRRLFERLGRVSQAEAETWLKEQIAEIDEEIAETKRGRRTGYVFRIAAGKYLKELQRAQKKSAELVAYHISLLLPYIGDLLLESIHGGTLQAFIDDRGEPNEQGRVVKNATINRTLEVVRTVLTRAARVWRDDLGQPWLATAPLIEMLDESDSRKPFPINWSEQRLLMEELAPHLQRMALFGVNTGLRDDNICGLQWPWERRIAGIDRSVFIIPPAFYKGGKRSHVVILNDVASQVVRERRGRHGKYVFAYGEGDDMDRLDSMNNTGWQRARERAGLELFRVHDLRHTFAQRLREAGVTNEDRAALLGHVHANMAEHYATPTIARLIEQANKVEQTRDQVTLLRVANG